MLDPAVTVRKGQWDHTQGLLCNTAQTCLFITDHAAPLLHLHPSPMADGTPAAAHHDTCCIVDHPDHGTQCSSLPAFRHLESVFEPVCPSCSNSVAHISSSQVCPLLASCPPMHICCNQKSPYWLLVLQRALNIPNRNVTTTQVLCGLAVISSSHLLLKMSCTSNHA